MSGSNLKGKPERDLLLQTKQIRIQSFSKWDPNPIFFRQIRVEKIVMITKLLTYLTFLLNTFQDQLDPQLLKFHPSRCLSRGLKVNNKQGISIWHSGLCNIVKEGQPAYTTPRPSMIIYEGPLCSYITWALYQAVSLSLEYDRVHWTPFLGQVKWLQVYYLYYPLWT